MKPRCFSQSVISLFEMVLSGCLMAAAAAGDWPQWRGPNRDGAAPESPPLIDQFAPGAPKKVWESEPIGGGPNGGYGQVSVAGSLVFVAANLRADEPIPERVLTRDQLVQLGWMASVPDELAKTMESARISEGRAKLKDGKEINSWIDEWLKNNLKPEWQKFQPAVKTRLALGSQALPLETFARLEAIKDKQYATPEAFAAALKEKQLDEAGIKQVTDKVVKTKHVSSDVMYALDRATGKIQWKQEFPGNWMWYPASTTPCVAGGRCYFMASTAVVYCLEAKDGAKVWESKPLGGTVHTHNRSSSVLVFGEKVIIGTDTALQAVDAKTGAAVWTAAEAANKEASAIGCRIETADVVICAGSKKVFCLDAASGKKLWSIPCGDAGSTPVIAGDCLVFNAGAEDPGLAAYKLSLTEPKKLWSVPFKDRYASPVVYKGYVYAVGENGKGRAVCVELESGKTAWEGVAGREAELASPILADGKLIATVGPSLALIKADPTKCELLGLAKLGLSTWISPAIADGKLFVRTNKDVICYDLAKDGTADEHK